MSKKELMVIEKQTTQRVGLKALYDLDVLHKMCTEEEDYFKQYGKVIQSFNGFHVYKDNGSDILAVAHLDHVADNKSFVTCEWEKDDMRHVVVHNGALDDRLGAFLILHVLPTLGLEYDILLTTGEESGFSTAMDFEPTKEYNWVFEFDRRGTDVVMYQYDTRELREMLEGIGLKVGWGSFSDIAYLDHLGVSCFNFGTGYYNEHMSDHHAVLTDTEEMAWSFASFYYTYKDDRLEYTKPIKLKPKYTPVQREQGTQYGWSGYGGEDYDDYDGSYYSSRNWIGNKQYITTEKGECGEDYKIEVDLEEYDDLLAKLVKGGMDYQEAEQIAWDTCKKVWEFDDVTAEICEVCQCLTDTQDLYQGLCKWCWENEDIKKLHSLTDGEWRELEGGG